MFDINKAVNRVISQKGRPMGKDTENKCYYRITISVTKEEKQKIEKYAKKIYKGNVSMTIKEALKKMKVFK